jgi:hypothetical protein
MSLRDTIAAASSGDTIQFAKQLQSQTITLTSVLQLPQLRRFLLGCPPCLDAGVPVGDVPVHGLLVVVVVCQRRMDLAEAQMGMMALGLLGVPTVGDPIQGDRADLDPGARDDGIPFGIPLDVCISSIRATGVVGLDGPDGGSHHRS